MAWEDKDKKPDPYYKATVAIVQVTAPYYTGQGTARQYHDQEVVEAANIVFRSASIDGAIEGAVSLLETTKEVAE